VTLKQDAGWSAVIPRQHVCISVALLPKLVMLPGRDPSLSEDDADRGAFFIFWSLVRCSQDATLIVGMCVCVSLSLSLTSSTNDIEVTNDIASTATQ
jgi:hypothetical protein